MEQKELNTWQKKKFTVFVDSHLYNTGLFKKSKKYLYELYEKIYMLRFYKGFLWKYWNFSLTPSDKQNPLSWAHLLFQKTFSPESGSLIIFKTNSSSTV